MPDLAEVMEAIAEAGGWLRIEGERLALLLPEENLTLKEEATRWGQALALLTLEAPRAELSPRLLAVLADAARRWGLPGALLVVQGLRLELGGPPSPQA
ncbi:MAG: hypothetical protein ABDH20_11295 [Thermus sp.]